MRYYVTDDGSGGLEAWARAEGEGGIVGDLRQTIAPDFGMRNLTFAELLVAAPCVVEDDGDTCNIVQDNDDAQNRFVEDGERLIVEHAEKKSRGSNSTILGAAAEHHVMCQLLRRNMIAALAPAGVPDADIVVSDRLGSALAAVQVKARRAIGTDGGWHMRNKHEEMVRPLLFYCFVDLGREETDPPVCWIVPSQRVAMTLKATHQAWLDTPGRGGKPHNDHDMRRLLPHYPQMAGDPAFSTGWLDPYRENWAPIAAESARG